MALGTSLFLLALGAVLTFGVTFQISGLDINAVGVVLMIVGSIGLLISMLFLSSFAPFYTGNRTVTTRRVERDI